VSYNGSGTFQINTSGQPVVTGTSISSTVFNALTADLATGLSTAITKDGQTTTTARIPFALGINSTLVTDATNTTSGSIITAGGVGIAKAVFIGTTLNVAGASTMTGSIAVDSVTDSSSTTTGSIQTDGGVGIAKALYVGTTANVAGAVTLGGVATFSAQPIFSSLTASSAVATDASKGLVSVTNTGTGNNVLATSPTLVTPALGTPTSGIMTNVTGINYDGFKNRIINSGMVIDQRNAGASVTVNSTINTFLVDRWFANGESADGVFTAQQVTTAPEGFNNSLKFTVTTADASIGATQGYTFRQRIEGYNLADLGWGTAVAKTITISFWVRSSITGAFGGSLCNSSGDRVYPFSFSISSADTWEQKSVTIAGDTTGTWLTTNGTALNVIFSLGVGSSYKGTAGAWGSTFYFAPTGSVNLISTNGATFYITGVQLEKGSTATAFDYRDYGREMIMCQRYYTQFGLEQANSQLSPLGVAYQATTAVFPYILPVKMRSQPTITVATAELIEWQTLTSWATTTYSSPTGQNATQSPLIAVNIGTSSMTAGRVYTVRATSTSGNVTFSSEL